MTHRVLLIEPGYRNKYPPLGLMKLASYHQARGDEIRFAKIGFDHPTQASLFDAKWDRVYVTTLFSFEWKRTAHAINLAIKYAGGQPHKVFVGGIAASLMHEAFMSEPQWQDVRFIQGLLDAPPANALHLSSETNDFGFDDLSGQPIEERVPDYSILEHSDYSYPVRDAYFGYASRGCVRKCSFCGVPKLEGAQREMPPLANLVHGVSKAHGEKKDLVLMDNNITASRRYREVIAEIRDLGFERGATLSRNGRTYQRRVDFNQGVDARILCKDPMYLQDMATIAIRPLRIAFDHLGVRKPYETAIRMAADAGIHALSNYMLYNFMDSPADLYLRMRLNIELNEALGIRIWSFPMRYQPVDLKDRSHVGKRWHRYQLRSLQVILQATHGVVSGSPDFFEHAYGDSPEAFERLLSLPHAFLFHRAHYTTGPGKPVLEAYLKALSTLTSEQTQALIAHLSSVEAGTGLSKPKRFARLALDTSIDSKLRAVLHFHQLDTKQPRINNASEIPLPPEEELVEDAGLFERNQYNHDQSVICRS